MGFFFKRGVGPLTGFLDSEANSEFCTRPLQTSDVCNARPCVDVAKQPQSEHYYVGLVHVGKQDLRQESGQARKRQPKKYGGFEKTSPSSSASIANPSPFQVSEQ